MKQKRKCRKSSVNVMCKDGNSKEYIFVTPGGFHFVPDPE